MQQMITFLEVRDPEVAAVTGDYDWSGSYSEVTVTGIPEGGLDRFIEDLRNCLLRQFPGFHLGEYLHVGDALHVYHSILPKEVSSIMIRRIDNYCVGWAGYDEMDKTPL